MQLWISSYTLPTRSTFPSFTSSSSPFSQFNRISSSFFVSVFLGFSVFLSSSSVLPATLGRAALRSFLASLVHSCSSICRYPISAINEKYDFSILHLGSSAYTLNPKSKSSYSSSSSFSSSSSSTRRLPKFRRSKVEYAQTSPTPSTRMVFFRTKSIIRGIEGINTKSRNRGVNT